MVFHHTHIPEFAIEDYRSVTSYDRYPYIQIRGQGGERIDHTEALSLIVIPIPVIAVAQVSNIIECNLEITSAEITLTLELEDQHQHGKYRKYESEVEE
jgi:hypothetical protein